MIIRNGIKCYTLAEVTEQTNFSRRQLLYKISKGAIDAINNGRWYIPETEIDKLFKK